MQDRMMRHHLQFRLTPLRSRISMFYEHTAYQDSQFYLYRQIQRANFPLLQREYNVVKRTIPYIQIIISFSSGFDSAR